MPSVQHEHVSIHNNELFEIEEQERNQDFRPTSRIDEASERSVNGVEGNDLPAALEGTEERNEPPGISVASGAPVNRYIFHRHNLFGLDRLCPYLWYLVNKLAGFV